MGPRWAQFGCWAGGIGTDGLVPAWVNASGGLMGLNPTEGGQCQAALL